MSRSFLLLMDAMRQANRQLSRLSRQKMSLKVVGGRVVSLPEVTGAIGPADIRMCAVIAGLYFDQPDRPEMRFILAVDQAALAPLAAAVLGTGFDTGPAMARSMLQEFGNVGASAIANHLSSRMDARVHISAPDVIEDTLESLANATIGSFLNPEDNIPVLQTELRMDGRTYTGSALLLIDRDVDQAECLISGSVKGI